MFITYKDVTRLFPHTKGFKNEHMSFETISFCTSYEQPKGLFVPLFQNDLQEALYNGAIAALWDRNEPLPLYTPNDFPVFFVHDMKEAAIQMIEEFGINHLNHETKMILDDRNNEHGNNFVLTPSAANQRKFILLLDAWKGRA